MIRMLFLFLLSFLLYPLISTENCELTDQCRLVDVNGDDEWVAQDGHYRSIQKCVDEAVPGDTCLIRSGRYHEEIVIQEKNNVAIRGDLDFDTPILDGTIVLNPKDTNNEGSGNDTKNAWKEENINGHTVCVGELEITDNKHPFQLFLKRNDEYEMLTNARWPNALWTDRHPETGTPNVFYNDYWGKSDGKSEKGKMIDRKDENGESPLAKSGLNMEGAMAVLNVGSFASWHRAVTSHTAGDDFFHYDDHDIGSWQKPDKAQYYIDSKEELLDIPGEWFYNKNTRILKFMPLDGKCPDPLSDAVRGRVIDYSIVMSKIDEISISDLDFFASNLKAISEGKSNDVNGLYLDSLNFMYPVSSHRMLQDDSLPKIVYLLANTGGPISVTNCVFYGGEGAAIMHDGKGTKIHNNLFQWNDWSGVMDKSNQGTILAYRQGGEEFISNTLWYNGAHAGVYGGSSSTITDNLFVGQRDGNIMNDGAQMHFMTNRCPWSRFERNWMFHSPISGFRIDGGDGSRGYNCTIKDNVDFNTGGYMIKGDYHNVTGNLALGPATEGDLRVIHILQHGSWEMNTHSNVENNAAWLADGGKNVFCDHGQGRYQLAGFKSNNYYGNHSYPCDDQHYDGSVVLDGEVVPDALYSDLPDLLVDVENYDFRPKPNTILTSTDQQIGPYPSVFKNGDVYSIPGRKENSPSYPIPSDNSTVKFRYDLIFQPAFRCNDEGDKHLVYIAKTTDSFPSDDNPSTEIQGNGNVVNFEEIGFDAAPDTWYKWRVDCLKGSTNKRKRSNVWNFKMNGTF